MEEIVYNDCEEYVPHNQVVTSVAPIVWWIVCRNSPQHRKQCVTVVRVITGENLLNTYRGKYTVNVGRTGACQLCDSYVEESVEHLLYTCPALDAVRDVMW